MKLLLTGPQGAGKTTVGELVAGRWPRGVHVDGDAFRRFVVSGRAEMTADPSDEALRQLRLRYALAAHVAAARYDRVVVLFPPARALFAEETERVGEWLDNSELTPEQTAAAILRA